jgi:uncharacterized membrane protein
MKGPGAGTVPLSSRLPELDFARGLAVLFMVAVHTLLLFSNEATIGSVYGVVVSFLGGAPAAPVFMFLMGAGIVFSSKQDPLSLAKRGLLIFGIGYLLNFLRGSLPTLTGYLAVRDPRLLTAALHEALTVDILQFAGLSLLLFALVVYSRRRVVAAVGAALMCMALQFVLAGIEVENPLAGAAAGLLWGASEHSYFPFLSWAVYPLAGFVFGHVVRSSPDRKKFYTGLLAVGTALTVAAVTVTIILLGVDIGFLDAYRYYHQGAVGNIVFLSFILAWLPVMFFLIGIIRGPAAQALKRWSYNVTPIYCIHWVILGWLTFLIETSSADVVVTFLVTAGVFATADLLAHLYTGWKRRGGPVRASQS